MNDNTYNLTKSDENRLSTLLPEKVYFVTGIDTDCGKTVATASLSARLLSEGSNCITQKLIQTGCEGVSDDILTHRKIEQRPLTEEDESRLTCPLIYTYPCSPHMAVALDGKELDLSTAGRATETLLTKYEKVLIEGAGGLMVPLTEEYLTVDYIADRQLPVILVTTAKLGSINHTLLSLEVLTKRGITLSALVYNKGISTDEKITAETERYLRAFLSRHHPETHFIPLERKDIPLQSTLTEQYRPHLI
ncbi:dethiobiotin synthase [Porphyromonas sp.]|uniref:dethiobiotin synthase n=1 Tax=Porphyromonas sp. TaxID=1924944 RepID=UPI0026DC07AD|nr:dethiobiotin synthase [Porphyromonas sp.]MDO4771582.1 dethiobiotin synthase [Porphyromonas sp.]